MSFIRPVYPVSISPASTTRQSAPDFNAVSTNLGIPVGLLGGAPTAAPATTIVYIQKEDKVLTESKAEILTRQKALFLTTDIDWDTCSITNFAPRFLPLLSIIP